jgi:hypothetical protein
VSAAARATPRGARRGLEPCAGRGRSRKIEPGIHGFQQHQLACTNGGDALQGAHRIPQVDQQGPAEDEIENTVDGRVEVVDRARHAAHARGKRGRGQFEVFLALGARPAELVDVAVRTSFGRSSCRGSSTSIATTSAAPAFGDALDPPAVIAQASDEAASHRATGTGSSRLMVRDGSTGPFAGTVPP